MKWLAREEISILSHDEGEFELKLVEKITNFSLNGI